jgi:hypothetical protein
VAAGLLVLAGAAAVVAVLAVRGRFWPIGPCRACRRRKGRGPGSTAEAWNRCRRCGGSGERIRPLARIWARHRETARQLARKRGRR